MISRHWTAICKRDRADAYVHHLKSETFPLLTTIAGFVRASILKRDVERGTEFEIITVWESLKRSSRLPVRMRRRPSSHLSLSR